MSTTPSIISPEIDLPLIQGRQCVPVRLLPFMTNWWPLSPDRIAELLGAGEPLHGSRWRIHSNVLVNGGGFTRVLPGTWASISRKLEVLAIELRRSEELEGQKEDEWERRSVELLPAACFVWRDELEPEYERTYKKHTFIRRRAGVRLHSEIEAAAELEVLVHSIDPVQLERIQQRALDDTIQLDGDGSLNFAPVMTEKDLQLAFEGFRNADPASQETSTALPERVPLMRTNQDRVLSALRAAGFNPLSLPPSPRGTSCPAKQAARAGANLTKAAFDHAWKDLGTAGELVRQGA